MLIAFREEDDGVAICFAILAGNILISQTILTGGNK